MALMVVADGLIHRNYSASTQSITLTASCAGATSFRWTLLDAPTGSTATTETRGNFVNGVATIQNPTFVTDAAVSGSYVFQCVASNDSETSNPNSDQQNAQSVIVVATSGLGLRLPGNYQYNWVGEHNYTLQKFEDSKPTSLATLNNTIGVTLDTSSDSRTPGGSAGGDLSGTYPNPTVDTVQGVAVVASGASNGHVLKWDAAHSQWAPGVTGVETFFDLTDFSDSDYADKAGYIVAANSTADGIELVSLVDVQENYPVFERDRYDTSLIGARNAVGYPSTFLLILNDDQVYTATSPLTIDADTDGLGGIDAGEAPASGLWHIYAVPIGGNTFGLVASQGSPLTTGPTSYAIWKYLWTFRWPEGTRAANLDYFKQSGQWYFVMDHHDSRNAIVNLNSLKPSTGWSPMDGSTAISGTAYVPNDIRTYVPTGWVKTVQLHLWIDLDKASGTERGEVTVAGGDPPDFSVNINTYQLSEYHGSGEEHGRAAMSTKIQLINNMASVNIANAGNDIVCGVHLRGYLNPLACV